MKVKDFTVSAAQAQLPKLVRQGGAFAISRHGITRGYYVSREQLEGLMETVEVLANPEAMKAVQSYRGGRMKLKSVRCLDEN